MAPGIHREERVIFLEKRVSCTEICYQTPCVSYRKNCTQAWCAQYLSCQENILIVFAVMYLWHRVPRCRTEDNITRLFFKLVSLLFWCFSLKLPVENGVRQWDDCPLVCRWHQDLFLFSGAGARLRIYCYCTLGSLATTIVQAFLLWLTVDLQVVAGWQYWWSGQWLFAGASGGAGWRQS